MSGAETNSIVLSILIITRNRKIELLRALQSCVDCKLPANTEFVIVDNASDDGTKEALDRFFQVNSFEHQYYFLSENTGAIAGRNVGFKEVKGRYVYFMDDDTYIDGPKQIFFEALINGLKASNNIFGIMPLIYDTEISGNRALPTAKVNKLDHCKKKMWFDSGGFLVDRQRIDDQNNLFLSHVFKGMPELYPSLKNYFTGKYIVEINNIQIIHEPSSHTRPNKNDEAIYHYTGGLHTKFIFYPVITYPVLYLIFSLRIIKHLGFSGLPRAFEKLSYLNKSLEKETVPLRKFLNLLKEYGFLATF